MSVRTQKLTKRFAKSYAVCEVDLHAREKETYGLIGLNGAGKTTTLSMLTTLTRMSSGEAYVGGASLRQNPQKVRDVVGFLPQDVAVPSQWRVWPFLLYLARLKHNVTKEDVRQLADTFQLTPYLSKKFGQLSHGQRKMVLFAQAYLNDPKVVLLDEPFTGLDPQYRHLVRKHILAQRGKRTQMISTHLLSEVEGVCDRVGVLHDGHLLKEEDLRSITSGYVFRCQLSSHSSTVLKKLRALHHVSSVAIEGNEVVIRARRDVSRQLLKTVASLSTTLKTFKRGNTLEEFFLTQIEKG